MAENQSPRRDRLLLFYRQWSRDVDLGMQNLLVHGMRSLLTMLGMIFGVAAVVAMLSIGAGARQKVMALIEQMGVHNLIVEAKETVEWQAHQKVRLLSPGLTLQDYRVIQDDLGGIAASTPRKQFTPSKMIPKAQQGMPNVMGVDPSYQQIAGLHVLERKILRSGRQQIAPRPFACWAQPPNGVSSALPILSASTSRSTSNGFA